MRLTELEINTIKGAITEKDSEALVYVFGSRVDGNAKGGDIDILVVSKKLKLNDKLLIKARIFERLEEQRLDIIIASDTDDPFVKLTVP